MRRGAPASPGPPAAGPGSGVRCRGLVHIYPTPEGELVALRGVDLDIAPGELVALLGPSGSGKSTLPGLLAGILRSSAGRVWVDGVDVGRLGPRQLLQFRATKVGLVLQGAGRNLLPYADALGNLRFAQRRAGPHPAALLDRLGLGAVARQPVATLSGGERQRVALAVGVAARPRLLLVDEPTANLDAASRDQVTDTLRRVNADLGITVVMVTHDPAVAGTAPRTVTIRDGRVGLEGRHGQDYAVVGQDGTIQLPPALRGDFPAGSLVRLRRHPGGIELTHPEHPDPEQTGTDPSHPLVDPGAEP